MAYCVYILRSQRTGFYYIGYTNNLQRRLREHNAGMTKSLFRHIPLEIVRIEEYSTYAEARRREAQIKRYKSGNAFRQLLH
ncbi:MAG: GIY-YIG nuclease family protein [Patescibacteria group bacterium]